MSLGNRMNSSITRRVTAGASSASPLATARIPATSCSGGTSLSRNPLAPARRASYRYSSMSKVVSMTTFDSVPSWPSSRRVASIPSMVGIRTSISTTCGRSRSASVTASSPFDASPTTSMSSCASRIMRKPARTSAWSSTISTRTLPSSSSAAVASCSGSAVSSW